MRIKAYELLQTIQIITGCTYLSDLHSGSYNDQVIEAIERLSPEDYPVMDWNEAVTYITQIPCECSSAISAQQLLCENLKAKKAKP